ncbi:MAG: DUF2256 domain-containing protein [Armatimonadetes bacterium]|nr:DUF2256 domain-containing protein [Armatimonadota bacterium]
MKSPASKPSLRNPHNLPTKICPSCQRAFVWRKKWERDWESVLYCSDACRKGKNVSRN